MPIEVIDKKYWLRQWEEYNYIKTWEREFHRIESQGVNTNATN